jgi:translation initiation factor 4G
VVIRSSCISKPQSQSIAVVTSLAAGTGLEPFAPLEVSAYRWISTRVLKKLVVLSEDFPELVERKVKALLNKLTMKKFDSISNQIIVWANKSEKEKDSRTLIQVIKLVYETVIDQAIWSEMYARLCRKIMEQISSKVQDDAIRDSEGKHITGGHLFRKYLLNRCQEDFERGWDIPKGSEDQPAFYSDEYYAAQKAKRQGLGLIKFIGELFKLQMLTERIMHECVKKLLGNVANPEEEEIESLCKLLSTVGSLLDTAKAHAHMDAYFSRMKELVKSPNVNSRMQFMLQAGASSFSSVRTLTWYSRMSLSSVSATGFLVIKLSLLPHLQLYTKL